MAPDPETDAALMYLLVFVFHASLRGDFDCVFDIDRLKATLLVMCKHFVEAFDDGVAGAVHLSLTKVGALSKVFASRQTMLHVGVASVHCAAGRGDFQILNSVLSSSMHAGDTSRVPYVAVADIILKDPLLAKCSWRHNHYFVRFGLQNWEGCKAMMEELQSFTAAVNREVIVFLWPFHQRSEVTFLVLQVLVFSQSNLLMKLCPSVSIDLPPWAPMHHESYKHALLYTKRCSKPGQRRAVKSLVMQFGT